MHKQSHSSTVDITGADKVTIMVSGSDLTALTAFDVFLSPDAGTTWYKSQSIYPVAQDSAGNPLATRSGTITLDVTGVTAIQMTAHVTETVHATVVGR